MTELGRIIDLLARGEEFCLATVISSAAPEAPAGGKAIVFRDGSLEGTLGSESLDKALPAEALRALADKEQRAAELPGGVRVFLELPAHDAKLLICGAGHIAVPLARFARAAGFSVTVLDDRAEFASPARFPSCEVIARDFAPALREMPLGPAVYAVVITRGHEHDADCLAEILRKKTAYAGVIGSRRRGLVVLEALEKKGLPAARLKDIFTPIGLPIGAESPEEIALAIIAELVCVRRKGAAAARALRAVPEAGK